GGRDKRGREPLGSRARGDLKAASMMKDRGLWMELCLVGMHGQAHIGIDYLTSNQSSNMKSIKTSVIVSGGYEDDEDAGDVIMYTGHGGQDKHSRQVVHQKLKGGNLAMEMSMHYGIEVRVIRGFKNEYALCLCFSLINKNVSLRTR
ncbi:histone-lysine N-methyltransferase family member SUVH9-like protein, partial [Tanacetum coccineum]